MANLFWGLGIMIIIVVCLILWSASEDWEDPHN